MNRMTERTKMREIKDLNAKVKDQRPKLKKQRPKLKDQAQRPKLKITLLAQTHILPIHPVPAVRLRRTQIPEPRFRSLFL